MDCSQKRSIRNSDESIEPQSVKKRKRAASARTYHHEIERQTTLENKNASSPLSERDLASNPKISPKPKKKRTEKTKTDSSESNSGSHPPSTTATNPHIEIESEVPLTIEPVNKKKKKKKKIERVDAEETDRLRVEELLEPLLEASSSHPADSLLSGCQEGLLEEPSSSTKKKKKKKKKKVEQTDPEDGSSTAEARQTYFASLYSISVLKVREFFETQKFSPDKTESQLFAPPSRPGSSAWQRRASVGKFTKSKKQKFLSRMKRLQNEKRIEAEVERMVLNEIEERCRESMPSQSPELESENQSPSPPPPPQVKRRSTQKQPSPSMSLTSQQSPLQENENENFEIFEIGDECGTSGFSTFAEKGSVHETNSDVPSDLESLTLPEPSSPTLTNTSPFAQTENLSSPNVISSQQTAKSVSHQIGSVQLLSELSEQETSSLVVAAESNHHHTELLENGEHSQSPSVEINNDCGKMEVIESQTSPQTENENENDQESEKPILGSSLSLDSNFENEIIPSEFGGADMDLESSSSQDGKIAADSASKTPSSRTKRQFLSCPPCPPPPPNPIPTPKPSVVVAQNSAIPSGVERARMLAEMLSRKGSVAPGQSLIETSVHRSQPKPPPPWLTTAGRLNEQTLHLYREYQVLKKPVLQIAYENGIDVEVVYSSLMEASLRNFALDCLPDRLQLPIYVPFALRSVWRTKSIHSKPLLSDLKSARTSFAQAYLGLLLVGLRPGHDFIVPNHFPAYQSPITSQPPPPVFTPHHPYLPPPLPPPHFIPHSHHHVFPPSGGPQQSYFIPPPPPPPLQPPPPPPPPPLVPSPTIPLPPLSLPTLIPAMPQLPSTLPISPIPFNSSQPMTRDGSGSVTTLQQKEGVVSRSITPTEPTQPKTREIEVICVDDDDYDNDFPPSRPPQQQRSNSNEKPAETNNQLDSERSTQSHQNSAVKVGREILRPVPRSSSPSHDHQRSRSLPQPPPLPPQHQSYRDSQETMDRGRSSNDTTRRSHRNDSDHPSDRRSDRDGRSERPHSRGRNSDSDEDGRGDSRSRSMTPFRATLSRVRLKQPTRIVEEEVSTSSRTHVALRRLTEYLSSKNRLPFSFLFYVYKLLSHKILDPKCDFEFLREIVESHFSGDSLSTFDEENAIKKLQIFVESITKNVNFLKPKVYDEMLRECAKISDASRDLKSHLSLRQKLFAARKKLFWRAVKELLGNQKIPGAGEDLDSVPQYCATITRNGVPLLFGPYSSKPNRVVRQYGCERFVTVSFELTGIKSSDHFLETYSNALCVNGMSICGRKHRLLSAPPSRLQRWKPTCEFVAMPSSSSTSQSPNTTSGSSGRSTTEDEWSVIKGVQDFMGDRANARTVFEFEARAGMSYSSTTSTITVYDPQIRIEQDVKKNGYNFTDGCGKISPDLADEAATTLHRITRGREGGPHAGAFQVRLGQFKGMLVVDSSLGNTIVLRPSMRKFAIAQAVASQRTLEVLHTNRPSVKNASVNRQIIMLLSALAPSNSDGSNPIDEYLISILEDHLEALTKERKDSSSKSRLREDNTASDLVDSKFVGGAQTSFAGLFKKCRFMVPDCWVLYGVTLETRELREGQVFVRINGKVRTGDVIVTKNPCIHPGDIRKLTAVDVPSLHHLQNVIVFSVYGNRPPSNCISGSDLDGDEYFISFNEILTSIRQSEPASYDPPPRAPPMIPLSPQERQRKLAEHIASEIFGKKLGSLYNSHVSFADRFGVGSPQALEVAHVLSRLIDADKTGEHVQMQERMFSDIFPHFVFNFSEKYHSSSILGKLHDLICEAMDDCGVRESEIFSGESGEERDNEMFLSLSPDKTTKWVDRWKSSEPRRPKHF